MHTGVISFCDRIAFNIKSSEVKDVILQDLLTKFQIKILQKHWHRLEEHNIDHIHRAPHFMMLRSNGNPYYMYLTRYEEVNQIMFIDKKVQPGYEKPRIILVRGKFDECLFDNTLLEGEMVKDERGQWIFLINDVIGYRNMSLEQEPLPKRLSRAYLMMKNHYKQDPLMDVCQFHIKKVFPAIKDSWEKLLELNSGLPYTNRGVYFWPFFLKYKPKLMNFDDSLIKMVTRKVKDDPNFREAPPEKVSKDLQMEPSNNAIINISVSDVPSPKVTPIQKGDLQLLYLRKTENPDVYNVFDQDTCKNKIGIAHIPTLLDSKKLRSIFKDITVAMTVPFYCEYNNTFQKWIPKELYKS